MLPNKHQASTAAPPADPQALRPLPEPHQKFLESSVASLKKDQRILGVAAGGSYVLNEIDAFSDLDLVLYISPKHYQEVLKERTRIATQLSPLIESFSGEHVGEPRLLICLYGPPLLHVDLKFVSLEDISEKVEDPVILWERGTQISSQLALTLGRFPQPDAHWIEARFWIWVHYTAAKIGRGELFEALDAIGFLRNKVLGPLLLQKHGTRPQGLRKIEKHLSTSELEHLKQTLAGHEAGSCTQALKETIKLYRSLRSQTDNPQAEQLACDYLDEIAKRV